MPCYPANVLTGARFETWFHREAFQPRRRARRRAAAGEAAAGAGFHLAPRLEISARLRLRPHRHLLEVDSNLPIHRTGSVTVPARRARRDSGFAAWAFQRSFFGRWGTHIVGHRFGLEALKLGECQRHIAVGAGALDVGRRLLRSEFCTPSLYCWQPKRYRT